MARIEYETIRDRLSPEAKNLFFEMVEAHMAASGDRFFLFLRHFGGNSLFLAAEPRRDWENVDGGILEDLATYGLLSFSQPGRDPNYRVTLESIAFYRWLMAREGNPVEQPEQDVLRFVESETFARRHPGCSHHISEALDLLRSDRTDDQTISELGGHLRNAIFDLSSDLLENPDYDREKPEAPLRRLIEQSTATDREKKVLAILVDLMSAVLSLDQRLTHVRDESDQRRPLRSWDEVRRAVFTTVFACVELDRMLG